MIYALISDLLKEISAELLKVLNVPHDSPMEGFLNLFCLLRLSSIQTFCCWVRQIPEDTESQREKEKQKERRREERDEMEKEMVRKGERDRKEDLMSG